jgi:GR25 family glycosyltransferase involved in LPS biosynthesis
MKLFEKFDETFLINLKKREDRLHNFIDQINNYDLGKFKIFEAIDGSSIPENYPNVSTGNVGLLHSGIQIIEESIKNNYEKILIIEDDCVFNENVKDIDVYFEHLPSDWDMVYFGGNHNIHSNTPKPIIINDKVVKLHSTYASHCVGLSKNIFSIVLEALKTFNAPIDVKYQQLQSNHNMYCFNPIIATQMVGFSDIENRDVDYNAIIKSV